MATIEIHFNNCNFLLFLLGVGAQSKTNVCWVLLETQLKVDDEKKKTLIYLIKKKKT